MPSRLPSFAASLLTPFCLRINLTIHLSPRSSSGVARCASSSPAFLRVHSSPHYCPNHGYFVKKKTKRFSWFARPLPSVRAGRHRLEE